MNHYEAEISGLTHSLSRLSECQGEPDENIVAKLETLQRQIMRAIGVCFASQQGDNLRRGLSKFFSADERLEGHLSRVGDFLDSEYLIIKGQFPTMHVPPEQEELLDKVRHNFEQCIPEVRPYFNYQLSDVTIMLDALSDVLEELKRSFGNYFGDQERKLAEAKAQVAERNDSDKK